MLTSKSLKFEEYIIQVENFNVKVPFKPIQNYELDLVKVMPTHFEQVCKACASIRSVFQKLESDADACKVDLDVAPSDQDVGSLNQKFIHESQGEVNGI